MHQFGTAEDRNPVEVKTVRVRVVVERAHGHPVPWVGPYPNKRLLHLLRGTDQEQRPRGHAVAPQREDSAAPCSALSSAHVVTGIIDRALPLEGPVLTIAEPARFLTCSPTLRPVG